SGRAVLTSPSDVGSGTSPAPAAGDPRTDTSGGAWDARRIADDPVRLRQQTLRHEAQWDDGTARRVTRGSTRECRCGRRAERRRQEHTVRPRTGLPPPDG